MTKHAKMQREVEGKRKEFQEGDISTELVTKTHAQFQLATAKLFHFFGFICFGNHDESACLSQRA